MSAPATAPGPAAAGPRRSPRRGLPFRGDGLGRFGLVLLVVLLGAGLLQPLLPLGDPYASVGPRLAPMGGEFPFGTDELGRSLLPRVVAAIQVTILLSVAAVLVTTVLGVVLGCYAAYASRRTDAFISRLADVLFSFPTILVAVLVSIIVGPGRPTAAVAIVAVTIPTMIRLARAEALRIIELDFVTAAEVAGARMGRILFAHLLPNMWPAIIVQVTFSISLGMLVEGGISFLGLGVQPPDSSLGALIGHGRLYLTVNPSYVLIPGFVLGAAVLAFNLVGDALRRELDPLSGSRES